MFLVDTHIHTDRGSSDSFIKVEELVKESLNLKIGGLCITEHTNWNKISNQEYRKLYEAHDIAKKLTNVKKVYIYYGLEIKILSQSKYLVLGVKIEQSWVNYSWEKAVRLINNAGGLIIKAHPYRETSKFQIYDGVEIYNPSNKSLSDEKSLEYIKMKIPFTLGSDSHFLDEFGTSLMIFEHEIKTNKQLIDAILMRECKRGLINGEIKKIGC